MKILFLTLVNISDINERNLYTDLMRKFRDEDHDVFIVTPIERRLNQNTSFNKLNGITLLKIKTLNIQKTNLIEKGISTLLIEHQFLAGIKKYILDVRFDLVLYSTPPITFSRVINYFKQRDKATSYLLLKDIFPQNAVDLEMIKKGGLIHHYFRNKEKQLYRISDFIGCMSAANVDYVIRNNPEINPKIVEVNPNSIDPGNHTLSEEEKRLVRKQYAIPTNTTVFIYGGNLGKPQGIDFLIKVLDANKQKSNVYFLIVGTGTEFPKMQTWFSKNIPQNAKLLSGLTKNDYDLLVQASDIGMIFLDPRYTIPNFPSRLLSYLEYKIPVIAATDTNTDLGKIISENEFGYWAESGNLSLFNIFIHNLAERPEIRQTMGENGHNYLLNNYTVSQSYKKIMGAYDNLKKQKC